jgi:hypothetical protein
MANKQGNVNVEPTPITAGQKIKIDYEGELTEKEADQVYLHAGVGFGDGWEDVTDIEMVETEDGQWTAQLKINTTERFNFCFKDNADNWDNNGGTNWSFEVHNGEQYS